MVLNLNHNIMKFWRILNNVCLGINLVGEGVFYRLVQYKNSELVNIFVCWNGTEFGSETSAVFVVKLLDEI